MKTRLSGRQFVPIFVGLIVVLSAIALWQRSTSETLDVIATRALPDGSTLQLARAESETFEAYLSLLEADGEPRWRKGIYRLVDPVLDGVTVGEEIITVRAADTRGNHETHAFGRKDGAFVWRGGRIEQAAPVAKPSERRANEIIEYYGPPVNLRLRLSAVNGDVLSKEPWPAEDRRPAENQGGAPATIE